MSGPAIRPLSLLFSDSLFCTFSNTLNAQAAFQQWLYLISVNIKIADLTMQRTKEPSRTKAN